VATDETKNKVLLINPFY